jgi:hypothetical protein
MFIMKCYKCLMTVSVYKHELGVVKWEIAWRDGQLYFKDDKPEPGTDGRYLNLVPDESEYSDFFADDVTIIPNNPSDAEELERLFDQVEDREDDDELEENGFELDDFEYNVDPTSVGSLEIIEEQT